MFRSSPERNGRKIKCLFVIFIGTKFKRTSSAVNRYELKKVCFEIQWSEIQRVCEINTKELFSCGHVHSDGNSKAMFNLQVS